MLQLGADPLPDPPPTTGGTPSLLRAGPPNLGNLGRQALVHRAATLEFGGLEGLEDGLEAVVRADAVGQSRSRASQARL